MASTLSAGLLLYRTSNGELELLIAHMGGPFWEKKHRHAWSIPKGEYGADEDPFSAAKREFEEELGTAPPNGDLIKLGTVRQSSGKKVTVFAIAGDFDASTAVSNTFEMEWPKGSGQLQEFPEVDRVEWSTVPQARERLLKGQLEFLDRLVLELRKLGTISDDPAHQESLF